MKLKCALVGSGLLLVAGCATDNREPAKAAARTDALPPTLRPEDNLPPMKAAARQGVFPPPTFASEDAAQAHVRALVTGGQVDPVSIGLARYLVVFIHGSGIPVTGIAIYRQTGGHWELVAQPHPPLRDFLRATAAAGKIFGVEERSGQRVMLYDPDEKKG